ncbi:MAG: iron-sulfur cluster assembly accessory protein [Alphaproteobacteria bacterium]
MSSTGELIEGLAGKPVAGTTESVGSVESVESMESAESAESAGAGFRVSARAVARIAEVSEESRALGKGGLVLRLLIEGGGCSGFQYEFRLESEGSSLGEEDEMISISGARVVVDRVSLSLLGGAELDYVREMIGDSFVVHNPNATSSCGCGTSFSI